MNPAGNRYIGGFNDTGLFHGTQCVSTSALFFTDSSYYSLCICPQASTQPGHISMRLIFADALAMLPLRLLLFNSGQQTGHGTYTYTNGENYVGNWEDGKRHGQGIMTYNDGRVVDGIWANNEPQ